MLDVGSKDERNIASLEKKETNSFSNCFKGIDGNVAVVVVLLLLVFDDERKRCDRRLANIP